MILETVRLCAAALADPTSGVNAQLATVPRDTGDPQPANVSVVEETTTGWVTRDIVPQDLTVTYVAVAQSGDLVMAGENMALYRAATVNLSVRVIAPISTSANATRALHYTTRAVQRALRVWLADASSAARTDNQVFVEIAESWTQSPVFDAVEDRLSVVTLTLSLRVRDNAP